MMKQIKTSLVIVALLLSMSFKSVESNEEISLVTGIYGVGTCCDTEISQSTVTLILNENQTFHYLNHADPERKINIKGSWSLKNKSILLDDHQSSYHFHDKWKINSDYNCISSRNGLNFYRLCRIN